MDNTVICSKCGQPCISDGFGTGYGQNKEGVKTCYKCIGEIDLNELKTCEIGHKLWLYLSKRESGWEISNWPGSLKLKPFYTRTGHHNIARTRIDVWFSVEGKQFWGVRYGHNTEICHIKRIKN